MSLPQQDLPVVVTGAAGMVGGNLVRLLLARGRQVRALVHRDQRALEGLDVDVRCVDLTDPPSLRQAFQGAGSVYHLAAAISLRSDAWPEMAAVNIQGTRNVVETCLELGVPRLVYFGSVHALRQEPYDRPVDESSPRIKPGKALPYERSKALGELEVQQGARQGLNTVTIIPTAIVGPYDFRPSYFGAALLLLAQGRLPALVQGGYDWVDVRDVAAGAMRAEEISSPGSNYLLSGHWHSITEVARIVAGLTGHKAPRLVLPIGLAELAEPFLTRLALLNDVQPLYTRLMLEAMRSNHAISHARASRELGYAPRPLEESLLDALAWFAAHHPRYRDLLKPEALSSSRYHNSRQGF